MFYVNVGYPTDGVSVGPFNSADEARAWANRVVGTAEKVSTWQVGELESPSKYEADKQVK